MSKLVRLMLMTVVMLVMLVAVGAVNPVAADGVKADYRITVKTTDKLWAGTDCTVTISLHGNIDYYWTPFKMLDTKYHNDFERGDTKSYVLEDLAHMGKITAIDLRLTPDPSSCVPGSDWYPQWVKVENLKSGQTSLFPINGWMIDCWGYNTRAWEDWIPQCSW